MHHHSLRLAVIYPPGGRPPGNTGERAEERVEERVEDEVTEPGAPRPAPASLALADCSHDDGVALTPPTVLLRPRSRAPSPAPERPVPAEQDFDWLEPAPAAGPEEGPRRLRWSELLLEAGSVGVLLPLVLPR